MPHNSRQIRSARNNAWKDTLSLLAVFDFANARKTSASLFSTMKLALLLSMIMVRSRSFIIVADRKGSRQVRFFPNCAKENDSPSLEPDIQSSKTYTRSEQKVHLDTGIDMQVITYLPIQDSIVNQQSRPPLLFLHGSFHGAWCWEEHFLPYFSSLGYPSVAISWRGTGGTFAGDGVKKVKIAEHEADLRSILEKLPTIVNRSMENSRPVVVCHSFGGLAVMKHLEWRQDSVKELKAIANFCVVPPSGNGKMTLRYLRRSLRDSWKVTAGLAMKKCYKDLELCKELFFTAEGKCTVSDEKVRQYMSYFERDSRATIDLLDLGKQLPSAVADLNGRAPFMDRLPPTLVAGGTYDFIVDHVGVEETASYYGTSAVYVDSPHDVMLGKEWKRGATVLEEWLHRTLEQ